MTTQEHHNTISAKQTSSDDSYETENNVYTSTSSPEPFIRFPVAIPTSSTGLTTFAYQLALSNRIPNTRLDAKAKYDPKLYTPTFIHDILMLPGSLSNLLEKPSPAHILARLTPAILPGFRARVQPATHLPSLHASPQTAGACVHGLLLLGEGKRGRQRIARHYRAQSGGGDGDGGVRRLRADVQLDVRVPVTDEEWVGGEDGWRVRRRALRADVWVAVEADAADTTHTLDASGGGMGQAGGGMEWTLEGFLEGRLGGDGDAGEEGELDDGVENATSCGDTQ